jgi:transcription elongation GreA/GreB family factor
VSDLRARRPLLDSPSGGAARGKPQRPKGVQPGHLVDVEDVDTGRVSTYRIASSDRLPDSGEISPRSPLGAALLGKPARAVVEFIPPKGGLRKLRILRFDPGSD